MRCARCVRCRDTWGSPLAVPPAEAVSAGSTELAACDDTRQGAPGHVELVESVVTSVWSDFVVPYVGGHAPHAPGEEGMFLARLQASSLWEAVLWQLEGNRVRQQQRDDLVASCQLRSASVFRPDLAEELWRPLAIQSGLLPAGEDVPPQGEEWDFLQAPWEYRKGRCVVRGCDAPFRADASGGPVSKFAALFDARPTALFWGGVAVVSVSIWLYSQKPSAPKPVTTAWSSLNLAAPPEPA